MKYVEIFKLDENGKQLLLARCELLGDRVVCKGDDEFCEELNGATLRLRDGKKFTTVTALSGLLFLEAIVQTFDSGYYSATDIQES